MEPVADAVERSVVRGRVTDEDQGIEFGKPAEAFGKLRLAVLAGSIERSRIGVAEAGDGPAPYLHMAFVKIVEAVAGAHSGDLVRGFVVAREDVHLVTARLQDLAAAIDAFGPGELVPGGDVIVGLDGEEAFEGLPIVVDVGEDQQPQGVLYFGL